MRCPCDCEDCEGRECIQPATPNLDSLLTRFKGFDKLDDFDKFMLRSAMAYAVSFALNNWGDHKKEALDLVSYIDCIDPH